MKEQILIIEDDFNIAELMRLYLEKEEYRVTILYNGAKAIEQFDQIAPNLVILDLMLPEVDGYEVLREIRKSSTIPVIMVTARGETFDKVLGLELGADDYVVKPFDPKELVARVKAVLRRHKPSAAVRQEVVYPNLTINLTDYSVMYRRSRMEIPPKELELFYFLAVHPNQVFTREQLVEKVWGYDFLGDSRTVDVHIKRLREKFQENSETWKIKTVWGVGYKFEV